MMGPSLAGLWGRKVGSLASFERYSDALKSSGIIWDDRALDAWLTDPQRMVPGNEMPVEGIRIRGVRSDLLAFLKETPSLEPNNKRPTGQAWRRAWEHVVPFFSFATGVRKMIYTTRAGGTAVSWAGVRGARACGCQSG